MQSSRGRGARGGEERTMIYRARHVVTMDAAPIENGAFSVHGNIIARVGRWDEVRSSEIDAVEDLGECVLLPGLINAHCHLDYTGLRGKIAPTESFTDWIRSINAAKAALTPEDYLAAIGAGFAEAAGFGTTTLANLEAFPDLLARMSPPRLRTWWFAETIDLRTEQSAAAVYEAMRAVVRPENGWKGGIGLAPHAPFTASARLYQDCAEIAREHDLPLTTHLAESREEMEM